MANFTAVIRAEPFFFTTEYNVIKIFIYHLWVCILIFGMASNTVSIMVFAKIGFRDNVTVTLLFLSVSDLLNLILKCTWTATYFILANHPQYIWPFDPLILRSVFFWPAYVFYDFSSFISVFLALARCVCVARPLRFKSMFTTSRTAIILVILFLVALAFRIPVMTIFRLTWGVNPMTNSTYRSIWVTDNFRQVYKANDIFNRNIVSWVAYITATTCVFILVFKLQEASRFRQAMQNKRHEVETENEKSAEPADKPKGDINPGAKTQKRVHNLSAKDLQVVRSVTLICIIFILSQLPFQIISTIRLLDPEFADLRAKRLANQFANHISHTFGHLNASVNIFVYYHFNTRYRETLFNVF